MRKASSNKDSHSDLDRFQPTKTGLVRLLESYQRALFRYQETPTPCFVSISTAVSQLTGYSQADFLERPQLLMGITHPDDRAQLADLLAGDWMDPTPLTLRIYRADGEIAWMEILAAPWKVDGPASAGIEGIIHDVTAQHQADQKLQENQALLSSIIDTAMDAIVVLNDDQEIIVFNNAAEEMFGYKTAEMLGKSLDRLLPDSSRTLHGGQMNGFSKPVRGGKRMGVTHVINGLRADGTEFPIEASISFSISGTSRIYTAIVRDITERRQSEDQLRQISTHDPLTGLFNRAQFEAEMERLEHQPGDPVAIVIADVDNLKLANDTFGHPSGDDLLRDVAAVIRGAFRSQDTVARLGGDEFGVLLPNADLATTRQAVLRIQQRLASLNRANRKLPVSLSIGLATANPGEALVDTLRRADARMYEQKRSHGSPRDLVGKA